MGNAASAVVLEAPVDKAGAMNMSVGGSTRAAAGGAGLLATRSGSGKVRVELVEVARAAMDFTRAEWDRCLDILAAWLEEIQVLSARAGVDFGEAGI